MTRGLLLIGATLAIACGHSAAIPDASTIDAAPRQTIMDTRTLLAGMLVEGSWLAGSKDEISVSLGTATGKFDWDIHAHANGGTQDIVAGFSLVTVSYDFHPSQQAQWYLLIRNSSTATITVDVSMELYSQAQWAGWQ